MSDFPKLARIKSDDENMERIHAAARKGQTEEVQRLIEVGVDPAIPNRFGCTALHLACKFGQVETAKFLASKCDAQTSWHGQKPIHLAVLANKLELVEALIDGAKASEKPVEPMLNDCDENVVSQIGEHFKSCRGQTALHWCVGLGDAYIPMLKLLVASGASPTTKDKDGETPLMRALEFNNEAALEAMLDGATKSSLRLDFMDSRGRTHLHWAILMNHQDCALRLLELGHDMNMEDDEHVVPLYLSIRAAMVPLTAALLKDGDPFVVQNAPFHNGSHVLADRIQWLDFVGSRSAPAAGGKSAGGAAGSADAKAIEERKQQVVQMLQERLNEIVSSLSAANGGASKKKKRAAPSVKRIKLAPSAPIRNRSQSRTKSTSGK